MTDSTYCPACLSSNIAEVTKISAADIITLYRKHGITIDQLLKNIDLIRLQHCKNCDLKFFNPAIAGDEYFYNQLQKLDWYFLHSDKIEFTYSCDFIKQGDKILDVGSGRGIWSKFTGEIKDTFYQGIEFSSEPIELAKKDGVNVIKESIQDHSKKFREQYDVVAAFQVLEHVDFIRDFFASCLDCVKPGGKLIIAVPNNGGFINKLTNSWLNIPPHHINHWNEQSLVKFGESFHLKVINVHKEKVTPVHRFLYYQIQHAYKIRKLMGITTPIVDISLKSRMINGVSFWLAKINKNISRSYKKADGHTIVIVYEK